MSHSLAIPYQPISRRYLPQSRPVSAKRVNGVRVSWFVIGSLFGIGLSFFLNVMVTTVVTPEYKRLMSQSHEQRQAGATGFSVRMLAGLEPAAGAAESTEGLLNASSAGNDLAPQDDSQDVHASSSEEYPKTLTLAVDRGDTLINMLIDEHVGYEEAADIVEALKKTYNPRKLRVGQEIAITLAANPEDADKATVADLSIELNSIESVVLSRLSGGSFSVEKSKKALSPELTYAGGAIHNSLFETGLKSGIPQGVLSELVKAYSYDIDFQREIRKGDEMEVLFERMTTEDGDAAGYGKIFYAMLNVHGKPIKIYRYEDKDGQVGFFNEKGESIVKALLRTPINGARISSTFGMRHHPVLGYSKMHRGTDFAAPTGTPIYAAGDGIISYKGRRGSYGNYVQIKHNSTYSTAYAHMSGFGSGIHNGGKVQQGQVIGYVGTTGRSTGPHLHYEVHKHGQQINPMQEKFKTGKVLAGAELKNFKQYVGKIHNQIAALPKSSTTIASR